MAAPTVGYAVLPIVPSLRGLDAELRRQLGIPAEKAGKDAGQKAAKGFRDAFRELKIDAQSLTSFGTKAVAVGGVVAFGLGKAAKAADGLNAAISANEQVFAQSSRVIQEWSKGSSDAIGLSRRAAIEAATAFGAFGKQAGLRGDELAEWSISLAELAADMAAFANEADVDQAISALQSGLAGQVMPLRRYQILLSETAVQQKAYALGIAEAGSQLTEQQKVLARQALIFDQSTDKLGQFQREWGELNTQLAVAQANWEDASAALGQSLLPTLTAGARGASDLLNRFQELSPETQKVVAHLTAAGAAGTILVGGLSLAAGAGMRLHDAYSRMSTAAANGNRVMAITTRTARGAAKVIGGAGLAFAAFEAAQALNQATQDTVAYDSALKRLTTIDTSNIGAGLARAAEESRGLLDDIVLWGERLGLAPSGIGSWEVEVQGTTIKLRELEGVLEDLWRTNPDELAAILRTLGDPAQVGGSEGALAELERIVGRFKENLDATAAAEEGAAGAAGELTGELDAQQEAMDASRKATEALERALASLTARQTLNTLAFDAGRVAAQSYMDAIDRSTDVDNLLRAGIGVGSAMRDLREGFFGTADAAEEADGSVDRVSKAMRALNDALVATNPDLSVSAIAFGRMSAAADAFRASLTGSARSAAEVGAALGVGEAFRDFRLTFRRLPEDIDAVAATLGTYRKRQTESIRALIQLGEQSRSYLATLLETGRSHDHVRREAERLRQEFIRQFQQAGMNERQIRRYLDLLGLAPESVETAIKLSGVEAARFEIQSYLQLLEGRIPESVAASVTAKIRAGDLDAAARELAALAARNPVRIDVEYDETGVERAKQDLLELPRQFDFAKAALGGYTEAQERGLEAVLALGDATRTYLSEVLASRGPEQARVEADRLREAYRRQFEQFGITGEAFEQYLELLGLADRQVVTAIEIAGFDRAIFEIETLLALLTDLGALSDEEKILISVAIADGNLDLVRRILHDNITNWNDDLDPVKVKVDLSDVNAFEGTLLGQMLTFGGAIPLDVDTAPAGRKMGEFAREWFAGQTVTLDADTTKAVEEHLRYVSLVTGIFPEVPLDADDTKAVSEWLDYVRSVTGKDIPLPLDADDTEAWNRYLRIVRGMQANTVNIPVGLDTKKAKEDFQRFMSGLPQDSWINFLGLPLFRGAQTGGPVPGSGSGDKIPYLLEPGEFVISRKGVQAAGFDLLDRINSGRVDTLAGSTLTAQVAATEKRAGLVIGELTLVAPSPERAMEEIVTNGAVWAHAAGFGDN